MPDLEATGSDVMRRLLELGLSEAYAVEAWLDYVGAVGLGPDDVAELIGLACAPDAPDMDADSAEGWVPVHAWRALGQLRAAAAVAPLLASRVRALDDEWAGLDLPEVFGLIGAPAIPQLRGFLLDHPGDDDGDITVLFGLMNIGRRYQDCRAEVVAGLTQVLHPVFGAEPARAGLAIAVLCELEAVEAIGVIRDAFARDAVDETIVGDLEDVEIELKLRQHRDTPRPRYGLGDEDYGDEDDRQKPFVHVGPKVGRNDPCPCGSGKKYKKCCLV